MTYFKLETYVPTAYAAALKTALAAAGAGRLGNYDSCFWTTEGKGQFRPLSGSQPFIGTTNQVEQVPEVKLETLVSAADRPGVMAALKAHHPYETPAFYWIPVEITEE